MLTLRGATQREVSARQPLCADTDGFKLYAAVRVEAHGRRRLEHLCRYITRLALSDERVQVNAARQVEFKLKTPWRDGTTHLVMSPLEFTQRLAALVPRPRLHLLMTASWLPFHAIGCPVWVVRRPAECQPGCRIAGIEMKPQRFMNARRSRLAPVL